MVQEDVFKEFQYGCYGGHLRYQNGTILANLISYEPRHVISNNGVLTSVDSDEPV